MKLRLCLANILLVFTLGCGESRYLYYSAPYTPQQFEQSFTVKDVVGSSNLDILWVIDNSGSMYDDQQHVIDNSKVFMSELVTQKTTQWKLGLISTHFEDGPYLGFAPGNELTNTSPNPESVFNQAVAQLGTNFGEPEESLSPILKNLNQYPTFLHRGSVLAVIVLTDSEEESPVPVDDFLVQLKHLKGDDNFYFYTVLAFPELNCSGENEIDWPHSKYHELVTKTNATLYTLCDADFGQKLGLIAKDLIQKVQKPRLYLQQKPVQSTIEVIFQGQKLPGGLNNHSGVWYFDPENQSIVFYNLDFIPDDKAQVEVHFRVDDGHAI